MLKRRTVLTALTIPVLSACGGSGDGSPESERNLYGRQLQELQQATATLDGGSNPLRTLASEHMLYQSDTQFWRLNPVTGSLEIEQRPGGAPLHSWLVVAAILDGTGSPVVTQWRPQTIWVVRGNDYISSRDLLHPNDTVFGVSFPQPPFSREGAIVVVEFVRGAEVKLVASAPVWSN